MPPPASWGRLCIPYHFYDYDETGKKRTPDRVFFLPSFHK
ncbi:hypothetical protein GS8_1779 [Geobacillus stearothermophilus]|uniref:Uncharacterized protein n=1 Tax=Geobacillus stearothermophilus TaxID=1422 RepID=A0A150NEX1_GEOSE|nr:hypothetical protein GS8_1779 [Geobacillus stearothermophilus]KYD35214.1 hypothetical protein B4114_0512 [Geobacillus stearothermophilus]